jgi:hypothetical protein
MKLFLFPAREQSKNFLPRRRFRKAMPPATPGRVSHCKTGASPHNPLIG